MCLINLLREIKSVRTFPITATNTTKNLSADDKTKYQQQVKASSGQSIAAESSC